MVLVSLVRRRRRSFTPCPVVSVLAAGSVFLIRERRDGRGPRRGAGARTAARAAGLLRTAPRPPGRWSCSRPRPCSTWPTPRSCRWSALYITDARRHRRPGGRGRAGGPGGHDPGGAGCRLAVRPLGPQVGLRHRLRRPAGAHLPVLADAQIRGCWSPCRRWTASAPASTAWSIVAMCADLTRGKGGFNALPGLIATALSVGGVIGPLGAGFLVAAPGVQRRLLRLRRHRRRRRRRCSSSACRRRARARGPAATCAVRTRRLDVEEWTMARERPDGIWLDLDRCSR